MYQIAWDPETGGFLLKESISQGIDKEIRPVFHEELDLLGLNSSWSYPKTQAPLLWAIPHERKYYYNGSLVAEVKGGSIFREPEVVVYEKGLTLEPVDIPSMLGKNEPYLRDLSLEAIEFIDRTFRQKSLTTDIFSVAFSGGKDSLVLLDLVQRALKPEDFVVVFNDTTMEITSTYQTINLVKERYPNLSFFTSRSPMDARVSWQRLGPPSRIHRWCCSVHKSAPHLLLLKRLTGKPQSHILVFDGVRMAESPFRSGYSRVTSGGKHTSQTNVSPILRWSSAEVFLYLLSRNLFLNQAYRFGLSRVGCCVCPFASSWSGFVCWRVFFHDCKPFLDILFQYAQSLGRTSLKEKEEFVASQAWASRAGGRSLDTPRISVNHKTQEIHIKQGNRSRCMEWLKVLGPVFYSGNGSVEIPRNGSRLKLGIKEGRQGLKIKLEKEGPDSNTRHRINAIAHKTAYCVSCRVCEAECPTGALSLQGGIKVKEDLCLHCLWCLAFEEKGCIAAKSLSHTKNLSEGESKVKGVNRYQGFGLRTEWLQGFFKDPQKIWEGDELGNRQKEALAAWLREGEIIDKSKNLTPTGQLLQSLGTETPLLWWVFLTNLIRNSPLIRWFFTHVQWGETLTKRQLVERLGEGLRERTRENAVNALLGLFEKTPLGKEMGVAEVSRERGSRRIYKKGTQNLPSLAVLYSLYRFAEATGRYHLELKDLYNNPQEGPYLISGISPENLRRVLRGLSERYPAFVSAELVRDLENVYLSPKRSSLEALSAEATN